MGARGAPGESVGWGGGGLGAFQRGAEEEGLRLRHGDAGVAGDVDELGAGGLGVLPAGDAVEVPGGVLDVVGVDGLVELELPGAFLVLAGVVEGDAALPVAGLLVGAELE